MLPTQRGDPEGNTWKQKGSWEPERGPTVQLALHGGDDKGNSLGSSSGGGHNVEGCSSGTTQVPVGGIQQSLVSCVGVSGGHSSLDNSKLFFQNLQFRVLCEEQLDDNLLVGSNLAKL